MTTISTPDDLLRVLSENPEWKAVVRREILTEERNSLLSPTDSWRSGRIPTMSHDHIHSFVIREALSIALCMGFQLLRTLDYGDLIELTLAGDTSDLTLDEVKSFRRADLVIEAADADGATHYIAVETLFTADALVTGRALRNARLLTRFTGHPAHAAVASVYVADEIRAAIASGQVYWHEMDDRSPAVE